MPPPPGHSILGRERGRRRLLPVFVQHQPRYQPAQWLVHVHEDVLQYAHTIVFAIVERLVRLHGLCPVLPPQPTAPAHGRSREPTDALRRGYRASQFAPALSSCMPRLGYLGDEESRFEILDNQSP
jgi:hypothetical protein